MDTTTVVAAAVGGVPAIVAAVFAARSSSQANRSTEEQNRQADRRLDAEALQRSQVFYEKLLQDADGRMDRMVSQVDRLQSRLDVVTELLTHEQDVSHALRSQIRRARYTAGSLGTTVEQFSAELADRDSRHSDAVADVPEGV